MDTYHVAEQERAAKEAKQAKRREAEKKALKSKGIEEPQPQQTPPEEDPYLELVRQMETMNQANKEMEDKLKRSKVAGQVEGEHA